MKTKLRFSKFLYSFAVIVGLALVLPTFSMAGSICIDNVSSGSVNGASGITISHTTSGTDRLMLVGVSLNPDNNETVTGITYNGTTLTLKDTVTNSNDARVEIWSLVAPDIGTHNVVITFSAALLQEAVAGVMTFTGVHQTTPLGTFASAQGDDSTSASLNVSSAAGELGYVVIAVEYDAVIASSGQMEHWNITDVPQTYGAGGTADGASPNVTMSWDMVAEPTPSNHWAIGGVSIKPASGKNLVMVTGNGATTGGFDDPSKRALFESWGWTVTAIDDDATQTTFNNAAANNDVMFISESSESTVVLSKPRDLDIGIVVEESYCWDNMNFATSGDSSTSATTIYISDNSHYITSPFSTGNQVIYTTSNLVGFSPVSLASGGQVLATVVGDPTLFVFETGAALTSGTAANRRVGFPTSESYPSNWNANIKTLLQRSLDWAAGFCGAGGAATCGTNLVMVTIDGTTTTDAADTVKAGLFESWGWTVTALDDDTADFSSAAVSNDVMFISESVSASTTSTKARDLNIGIVVEEDYVWDEMGFGTPGNGGVSHDTINITDNDHYITSSFSTGNLTVYSAGYENMGSLGSPSPTLASGGQCLANENAGSSPTLFTFDTGASLVSGTAANRRVGFPSKTSNPTNWTADLKTLLKLSLEWAAGCGAGGTTNSAPVLNTIGNKNVTVGELLEFTISGTDPDTGDTLTYSASNLPTGASFDPGTQTFSWTPTALDVGSYTDVEFTVTDDGTPQKDDSELITITVYAAAPPPDLGGYSCNMKITIDSGQVAGDLNYFPVLIDVTDESLKTSGCGFMTDPAGDDLIFTNSTKSLQLDHEIEKYDGSAGELVAWVQIPFLSGSTNTDIYMYYGNSGVSTAQENPTGVWDENGADDYIGVWHFHDDYLDSTSYDNDGDPNGVSHDSGKIGDGIECYGGNDWVRVPDSDSLHISDEITVSMWIEPDDTDAWRTLVSKMQGCTQNLYWVLYADDLVLAMVNPVAEWYSGVYIPEYTWTHVAFTYDGSTTRMYRNGIQQASTGPDTGTLSLGTSNFNALFIGTNMCWDNEDYDGEIDEVRISKKARSAEWIQTSYNNQNSPSSFYSTEIQCPNQTQPEDFSCSMELTIDNTKVSGSSAISNFPVLITLTDDALKSTSSCGFITNSNGYDIMFTDSNDNQLDHEIEKYDGSTGELVAWVKKTISPTADDPQNIIRMYYGNSNVCGSLENPTAVWDSNYTTVWHLKETSGGSGAIKDSTARDNHGTDFNSPTFGVTGKIGNAIDFDGTSDYATMPTSGFNTSAGTVELWANIDTFPPTDKKYMFSHFTPSPIANRVYVELKPDNTWGTGMGDTYDLVRGSILGANTWYHLVLTWDGANVRGYRDGALNFGPTSYSGLTTIGNIYVSAWDGTDEWFDGTVDEVRVSDIARSADWIKTSHNNQRDPSSFYSVTNNTCSIPEPNPADFRCWRPITIDKDYVMGSTDLVNFPLLIKINSDPLLEISNPPTDCGKVQHPDGYDIIFTDQYGTELLDHEIETYNSSTGQLVAWVRIPQLSTFSDTVIRMYYGNANIGCPTENPTGVWDSNYMGVWHLSDTSGDTQDSTSHATSGSLSASGVSRGSWSRIYNSFSFGDSGEVDWGNPSHLNAGTQSWTVSLWANIDYNRGSGAWEKIINKGKGSNEPGYEMELDDTANNLYFAINDGSTQWGPSTGTSFTTDTWIYFVGVVDRSTQYIRLYKNGDEAGSNYIGAYGSIDVNDSLTIGKDNWGWPAARIEEVRVSNTARSADWIKTEWYNQNGSVAFYTLGDDSCETEYSYQYCQKITIDHNKVSGSSHSNFPLLVKLTTDDLKWVNNGGLVENEFGYDIAFKDENCTMLDYELESYDKDTGTLVAWVRVPTLSGSTDTEIYMYYGNPFIDCPSDNPTGVWNSYYQAVYHLNDDFQDSTSNDRDGTNHGAAFASGKIGKGALFDPTDGYDYIDVGTWSVSGDDITIQAWVYPETFNQNDPRIISKCDDDSASEDNHVFMLSLYNGNNGENRLRFRIRGTYNDSYDECVGGCDPAACVYPCYWNTVWYTVTDTLTLYGSDPNGYLPTAQAWYFVAGNYEDDNSTEMQLYRDDGLNAGGRDHNGNLVTNTWDVWIGANPYGSNNTEYSWHGVIDEVRILSMDLSQDWLRTEYNNINDPSSFYSLGSCTRAITPVTSEWREEF